MGNCYIHAWRDDMWNEKAADACFGDSMLRYAASNRYRTRGIDRGDRIYPVNVRACLIYLGGRIIVDDVVDATEAAERLGVRQSSLYDRSDYALADPVRLDRFRARLWAPDAIVDRLRFQSRGGKQSAPARAKNGGVDRQAFRQARLLVPGHEKLLDDLLGIVSLDETGTDGLGTIDGAVLKTNCPGTQVFTSLQ